MKNCSLCFELKYFTPYENLLLKIIPQRKRTNISTNNLFTANKNNFYELCLTIHLKVFQ